MRIINDNINKLHDLATALLENETIESQEFIDIINNGYEKLEPQEPDKEKSEENNTSDTPLSDQN